MGGDAKLTTRAVGGYLAALDNTDMPLMEAPNRISLKLLAIFLLLHPVARKLALRYKDRIALALNFSKQTKNSKKTGTLSPNFRDFHFASRISSPHASG